VKFKTSVLKRDWPEIVRLIGTHLFREENDKGFVNGAEVRLKGVKIMQRSEKIVFSQVLEFFEKGRAKAIRLGLELSFMERTAIRSSSIEKGLTREAAWKESREVEKTSKRRSRVSEAERG
jgi:hypothetical protein